ncbi:glycosyltransferase family 2 protein [Opitutaceae bacterium]|nr:glycosyltransferase family 2 protein [Opitutaceae bacterium]
MSKLPISLLIPALNEASNITDCIKSAEGFSEIVLVDSGSSDGTCDMARKLGARVVDFDWNGKLPKKKNWALANVTWQNEWVFILDADERLTPELVEEIGKIASAPSEEFDGYYVNRKFWFLDGWLNHCGYYPSWNLRFFRHHKGRYEQLPDVGESGSGDNEVHEHVQLEGKAGHLVGEMEHYAFPTLFIWVEKHNRYSNWEAKLDTSTEATQSATHANIDPGLARKRRLKQLARRLPFRPFIRFCYHYFGRLGILDGYRGFIFCRLMGIYEFLSVAKGAEIRRTKRRARS